MESFYNPIKTGKRIREIRKSKGMSLSDLASQLRISVGLLMKYELGEVPIPLKVAGETIFIFHVNPKSFICYEQEGEDSEVRV